MKKVLGMTIVILIFAAIGAVILLGHADENIFAVTYANKAITDVKALDKIDSGGQSQQINYPGLTVFMIDKVEFGKYKEKLSVKIPEGKDLYANLHIVASPEGMKFKVKWLYEGKQVKVETKALSTPKKGAVCYVFEGYKLHKGKYAFEVFYKDKRLYKKNFAVE